MKYMGSKSKISVELKAIFDLNRTSLNQYYVEPFCGGCNMIDKIKGNRIAAELPSKALKELKVYSSRKIRK